MNIFTNRLRRPMTAMLLGLLLAQGCTAMSPADESLRAATERGDTAAAGSPGSVDTLTQAGKDLRRCRLKPITNDVVTDGRHMKIRGVVVNDCDQAVDGIRYLVRIFDATGVSEKDSFRKESSTTLAPGEKKAMALDYATMYAAGGFRFQIEAYPIQLGEETLDPPPDW